MRELPYGFYNDQEREDAARLEVLLEQAEASGPMTQEIFNELQEIAMRSPKPGEYEARRQEGDTLYIKAWPGEEPWYHYAYEEQGLDPTVKRVVCVGSAYPVAWLLLARQLDGGGDSEQGRKFAEVSLGVEEHAASLCEVGAMVGAEGELEMALGLFSRAFELREDVPPWLRSRAALGVGVTLLEDSQLDQAEEAIKLALQFDPESEVAKHALQFVEDSRGEQAASGDSTAPAADKPADLGVFRPLDDPIVQDLLKGQGDADDE